VVSRRLIAGVTAGTLVVAAAVTSAATFRPDLAIRVATGFVAHNICAKTFVSGLDPQSVFDEVRDRAGTAGCATFWSIVSMASQSPSMLRCWGYSTVA
jgi:hypothetical protein